MPFEIYQARLNDIARLIEIEFEAYANSPDSKILRARNKFNIEHHVRAHRRYHDLFMRDLVNTANFYKIVDTEEVDTPITVPRAVCRRGFLPLTGLDERGKTVGWYRYEIFPDGIKSNVPLDHGFTEYEWPMVPREHREVVREYWRSMERDKRRCLPWSRPHIQLCLIAIHPSYQRRGAGRQILEHFCYKADYLQLPTFCQASVEGRALYERFGFETRKVSCFPTDGIGIPGTRVLWNMVREPKPFVPKMAKLSGFNAENDIGPMNLLYFPAPEPAEGEAEDDHEVTNSAEMQVQSLPEGDYHSQ